MNITIIGASGYTGGELLRLLALHPHIKIAGLTSEQSAGKPIHHLFPALAGFAKNWPLLTAIGKPQGKNNWPQLDALLKKSGFFFTALPHATSTPCVKYLRSKGARVIDLSADFRLKDLSTYESWYAKHEAPELIEEAVYGLPEIHREKIKKSDLVATPGCYPTAAILALAPLLAKKWLNPKTIIIDSKSGTTGAGRAPKVKTLFSEVHGGIGAYGIACHRHTPEIEQELSQIFGKPVQVTFTPHLVPMARGIFTVAYADLNKEMSQETLLKEFETFYQNENYIRVSNLGDPLPKTNDVLGSYFANVTVRLDARNQRVIAITAIDNLCRGASGLSVASMNLMNNWPEDTALKQAPLFP